MNFFEVKCVAPSYTLKIMKSQKKLARVCVYTPAYTQIREGGAIYGPPPNRIGLTERQGTAMYYGDLVLMLLMLIIGIRM